MREVVHAGKEAAKAADHVIRRASFLALLCSAGCASIFAGCEKRTTPAPGAGATASASVAASATAPASSPAPSASAPPPPPLVTTVVARDQNQPVALRVDAANVYWVNHGLDASGKEVPNAGSIMRAPKEGGTPVVIAAKQDSPTAVGVDAANVYWTVLNGVRRAPVAGGPSTTLFTLPAAGGMPMSLAITDKEVLIGVLHMTKGGVYRVAKTGGGKPVYGGNEDEGFPAWGIAPHNTYVFVCNGDGSALGRANLSMHYMSVIVEKLGGCHGLTSDSDAMYWGEDRDVLERGHIRRLPFLGAGTPELAKRMMESIADTKDLVEIAVDDASVYWTEKAPGRIMRVSKKGGPTSIVINDLKEPQALAVDDTYVYWAEPSVGAISKAPKSPEAAVRAAATPSSSPSTAAAAKAPASAKACDPNCFYNGRCALLQNGPQECCQPVTNSVLGADFAAKCRAQERAQSSEPPAPRCQQCLGKKADGSSCMLLSAMGSGNVTPCCEKLSAGISVCPQ